MHCFLNAHTSSSTFFEAWSCNPPFFLSSGATTTTPLDLEPLAEILLQAQYFDQWEDGFVLTIRGPCALNIVA